MAALASHLETLFPRQHNLTQTAANVQTYWGYCPRVVPCTSDAASCAYFDSLYRSQSLSTWSSVILWGVIGSTVYLWALAVTYAPSRRISPAASILGEPVKSRQTYLYRLCRSVSATSRHLLLPDSVLRIFGQATRRHVLVLFILVAYLTVFTFIGITYQTWMTPVPNNPGVYDTRTGLAPWADRIGVLAFALTPLAVMLSTRESLLSLFTGIPYQHFSFLHRWLGYIIFLQSALHSVSWTIIKARLYRPQPMVWTEFIHQPQYICGVLAMCSLALLVILSTPWAIRRTGYDFFRRAHWLMAIFYLGACWGHWNKLACWMISSFVIFWLDHLVRVARMIALHRTFSRETGSIIGFSWPQARITLFPDESHGDVVRLDFEHYHDPWHVGQHFFLRFPALRVGQSHPFTPASLPGIDSQTQEHTYIIRARKGETRLLAELARRTASATLKRAAKATTPVVLTGPYGTSMVRHSHEALDTNILCIAGGTGITFVLPVLQMLLKQQHNATKTRMISLIWAVRNRKEAQWIQTELDELNAASNRFNLQIHIFVTREVGTRHDLAVVPDPGPELLLRAEVAPSFVSSTTEVELEVEAETPISPISLPHYHQLPPSPPSIPCIARRPDLPTLVRTFIDLTIAGPTIVYGSGPAGMMSDLRSAVAACNDGGKVWRGDERGDVSLVADDRGGW